MGLVLSSQTWILLGLRRFYNPEKQQQWVSRLSVWTIDIKCLSISLKISNESIAWWRVPWNVIKPIVMLIYFACLLEKKNVFWGVHVLNIALKNYKNSTREIFIHLYIILIVVCRIWHFTDCLIKTLWMKQL